MSGTMITQRISMRVLGLTCQATRATPKASLSHAIFTIPFRQQSTICNTRIASTVSKQTLNTTTKAPSIQTLARQVRLASTTASPSVVSAASSTSTSTTQPLTWNRFLEIRKVRRQLNVITSTIGVAGALFLSMYIVTTQDVDVIAQKYLGLDVLITMGIVVVATSAAGWLIGPIFGNLIFNMRYRALRGSILEKEKEFFQRIAKHRVDPTRSSYQNPVPDYYGEKIGSVRDYRRWLKDQRAFNLKRSG